jgi:ribose transport system substrate-binding protein
MNSMCLMGVAAMVIASTSAEAKSLQSVGITVPSFANPYFNAVVAGAEAQARAINPAVKIQSESPEYDLNKQASIFDTFIANQVNVIIIAATDAVADGPLVSKAEAAGIVVVAADSAAPGVDAAVQTDNVQLGIDTCRYMVKRIGGKADIVILNGPSVAPIIARVKGCKQVLAGYPGITVLSDNQNGNATRDGGLNVMETLLTRFSHVDAVFAINDQEAIGASLAARQLHRSDPVFFGVDGSPDGVAAIKDPSTRVLATGAQDPYALAQQAVVVANGIMNGKEPAQKVIQLKPILVTQENVGAYQGWTK